MPGRAEMQNDLILDYCSNVALYPEFQKYLRDNQPPFPPRKPSYGNCAADERILKASSLLPLPILQRSHGGEALEVFGEEGGIGEVEVFRDLSD